MFPNINPLVLLRRIKRAVVEHSNAKLCSLAKLLLVKVKISKLIKTFKSPPFDGTDLRPGL